MDDTKKEKPKEIETEGAELDLDDLAQVTGGSLKDVKFTKTVDISEDIKSRI